MDLTGDTLLVCTSISAILPRDQFLRRNRTNLCRPLAPLLFWYSSCNHGVGRLLLIVSPVAVVHPSRVHRCHHHIRGDDMCGWFGRRHATA